MLRHPVQATRSPEFHGRAPAPETGLVRIGVVVPGIRNRFIDKILAGARSVLREGEPVQLVLTPVERASADDDSALDALIDSGVAGIIAVAPRMPSRRLDEVAQELPVVVIGRHDRSPHYDSVVGDDRAGARLAMSHLLDAGHTDIVHLTHEDIAAGAEALTTHAIRLAAYEESLRERGLSAHARILRCDSSEESADGVVRELLGRRHRPTAIFAAHDQLAMGALRALAESGLDRSDLAVVGYDNTALAANPLISLTSVDQEGEEMGRRAAELVIERLLGRTTAVRVLTEVRLVVRESSNAPPPSR